MLGKKTQELKKYKDEIQKCCLPPCLVFRACVTLCCAYRYDKSFGADEDGDVVDDDSD